MVSRNDRIFAGVDIDAMSGLEIGPLDKPLVAKNGKRKIFYADYADKAYLAEKSVGDPNVNIKNIQEIDFVIKPPLPDNIGRKFDYIVSSHVAEHVPDILGWLHKLAGWLNPGGIITFATPDYRYCFDRLRFPSRTGEVVGAFLQSRQAPPPSCVYDGMRSATRFEAAEAWINGLHPTSAERYFTESQALSFAKKASDGEYVDCHCWVWTAGSFKSIMAELCRLGLTSLVLIECHGPYENEAEFYVKLKAPQSTPVV
jgi:SAM-dependent methyltransferase